MISAPQGDCKHMGHVGMDGAYFGDISFLGGKVIIELLFTTGLLDVRFSLIYIFQSWNSFTNAYSCCVTNVFGLYCFKYFKLLKLACKTVALYVEKYHKFVLLLAKFIDLCI